MSTTKTCVSCKRTFLFEQDVIRYTKKWRLDSSNVFACTCACGAELTFIDSEVSWFNPTEIGDGSEKKAPQGPLSKLGDRKKFPYLSTTVVALSELLRDPNTTSLQLADAARQDPLIAAGILTIANNMQIASGKKIQSLEHAVVYVGRESILLIVLTAAIGMLRVKTSKFRAREFWKEAFLTGLLAEALTPLYAPKVSHDSAYLAGCLCNVGKLVSAIYHPEVVDRIALQAQFGNNPKNWIAAEKAENAINHTIMGEFAGHNWGLPDFILQTIEGHHDQPKFGVDRSNGLNVVEIVSFANQISHIVHKRPYRNDKDMVQSYSSILGLKVGELGNLVLKLSALKQKSDNLATTLIRA
jgi:HD-like signal output (HDOD) protein